MKKCKCISNDYFNELGNDEYNVFVGDIYRYMIINTDTIIIQVIDLYNNTIVFMLKEQFNKSFIDLFEYRKQKINKLLC